MKVSHGADVWWRRHNDALTKQIFITLFTREKKNQGKLESTRFTGIFWLIWGTWKCWSSIEIRLETERLTMISEIRVASHANDTKTNNDIISQAPFSIIRLEKGSRQCRLVKWTLLLPQTLTAKSRHLHAKTTETTFQQVRFVVCGAHSDGCLPWLFAYTTLTLSFAQIFTFNLVGTNFPPASGM